MSPVQPSRPADTCRRPLAARVRKQLYACKLHAWLPYRFAMFLIMYETPWPNRLEQGASRCRPSCCRWCRPKRDARQTSPCWIAFRRATMVPSCQQRKPLTRSTALALSETPSWLAPSRRLVLSLDRGGCVRTRQRAHRRRASRRQESSRTDPGCALGRSGTSRCRDVLRRARPIPWQEDWPWTRPGCPRGADFVDHRVAEHHALAAENVAAPRERQRLRRCLHCCRRDLRVPAGYLRRPAHAYEPTAL